MSSFSKNEWSYVAKNYIDNYILTKTIKEVKRNKPGSDIYLRFWVREWGNNSLNPLSHYKTRKISKANNSLVKSFQKTIKRYNLKYLSLTRFNNIILFCLPAFEDLNVTRLEITIDLDYYDFLTETHLNIICNLLKNTKTIERFSWGVEPHHKCWARMDDVISALSKAKIFKLFSPYKCSMRLDRRNYFHKMLMLKNLREFTVEINKIRVKNNFILLQRVLNESSQLRKISIEYLKGFPEEIKWLVMGNKSEKNIFLSIEGSGPRNKYPNFELFWVIVLMKKKISFDFRYAWSINFISFNHGRPKYSVNLILSSIERNHFDLPSYAIDRLLADDLDLSFRFKSDREEISKFIYPLLQKLPPEGENRYLKKFNY